MGNEYWWSKPGETVLEYINRVICSEPYIKLIEYELDYITFEPSYVFSPYRRLTKWII